MILGIDASNLRLGGGRTHLIEVLRHGDETRGLFDRVVVWGSRETLALLPERPWLEHRSDRLLEGSALARLAWLASRLPLITRDVDVVLSPGGLVTPVPRPVVAMSRNLLLFDRQQRRRYTDPRSRARLELLRLVQLASYRRAAGVIFLSKSHEAAVHNDLGSRLRRTAVIAHGVGDAFVCPPRPQRALHQLTAANPFRLIYVSAIEPYKNHRAVIEAVVRLRATMPIELTLVGAASEGARRELQRIIDSHRATEFVRWHGNVAYREVAQQVIAAEACVFASSCETFGIALLEAMAAGLPVASSNQTSLPEVLGDAGVYFDPGRVAMITETLRRLILDPQLRADLATRAHARARTFTWRRCAAETFAFVAAVTR